MSRAKAMHPSDRDTNYIRQNGSLVLTPRQTRRFLQKYRRFLKRGWVVRD